VSNHETELLAQIVERQVAIEERLASLAATQRAALESYEASQEAYREELAESQRVLVSTNASHAAALKDYEATNAMHRQELAAHAQDRMRSANERALAVGLRVIAVILLLYVSYKVSE